MDEIVELVAKRTGMPEAKARQAVETVMEVLKERLPEPIAGQVETVLKGGDVSQATDLLKNVGGLFGKK